jgi:hypothetical protein
MSAKMVRDTGTGQFSIEVTYPNNDKNDLWEGIIEHCCKSLSDNELKAVYADCNKQLKSMKKGDVPFNFRVMLDDLRQTIIKRKAYQDIQFKNKEGKENERKD